MSLGPVVRNVHANEHAEPPKPHLAERQEDEEIRYNALGAIVSVDGKLTFRPAYAGKNPAVLPVPYKEPAYVPFQGDNAVLDPAPLAKKAEPVVAAKMVEGSPWQVGDRVRMGKDRGINPGLIGRVLSVEPRGESHVTLTLDWEENPDKDDGKWTLNKVAHRDYFEIVSRGSTAQPETMHGFKIGDRVELNEASFYRGKKGTVTGFVGAHVLQLELDGVGPWTVHFEKARRLEATPAKQDWDPKTSPLQVGDVVEITRKGNKFEGKQARVAEVYGGIWRLEGMGLWDKRDYMKIVERQAK